ncbi:MAG: hypothetical protein WBG43_04365 [Marinifilaceae bacterium]
MAKYIDASDWNEMTWYNTGGTRDKSILQNPTTGEVYYFKTSLIKPGKEYIHEFWSEIIASEIGRYLEFDLLIYDIAFHNNRIGCISKSMVKEGDNKLTEGISYLKGYGNEYNPESRESKKEYTFQRIKSTFRYFGLEESIYDIIKIIIFDSIIGNSDRHQENWGFILEYDSVISLKKNKLLRFMFRFFLLFKKENKKNIMDGILENPELFSKGKFAPIYDSGSCLGRELLDEKVSIMLKDNMQMKAYAYRGKSEIHWNGNKLKYTELIENLLSEYSEFVIDTIQKLALKFEESDVRSIVENIDLNLPIDKRQFKLPNERKKLIIKLISLRIEKLKEVIK